MTATIIDNGSELSRIKNNLETLIDKLGIDSLLSLIETICSEKAEHIEENWQDTMLAKRWERLAKRIDAVSVHAAGL